MILRARWLLRPGRPPVENAALAVRDGRVAAVGTWNDLHRGAPSDDITDLGDAVVLPGMVNAHTHLELSDFVGDSRLRSPGATGAPSSTRVATEASTAADRAAVAPAPERFTDWLKAIVAYGRRTTPEQRGAAVRAGLAESLSAGVTALAEISYAGAGSTALADSPIHTTCFVEVYGHVRWQFERSLASAVGAAERLPRGDRMAVGLSPHAPYSAGVDAFIAAAEEADRRGWPLTMHLHETRGEIDLYMHGRGEFHDWMLVRWSLTLSGFRPPGVSPIQALAASGFFDRPRLVAHGNYLDDTDIDVLRRSRSSVAFCPRSHDYFGHREHPYRRLRAAGVPVALGTDSLASSPSLSVLDEMRFLHQRDGDLPPEALLAMGTSAGADALGLGGRLGRLEPGESADLAVLSLPDECACDPYAALLSPGSRVAATWIAGRRRGGGFAEIDL